MIKSNRLSNWTRVIFRQCRRGYATLWQLAVSWFGEETITLPLWSLILGLYALCVAWNIYAGE